MSRRTCTAVLGVVLLWTQVASAEALRVCLPERDPPRSEREGPRGLDVDLMAVLASALGRELRLVWVSSRPTMVEVEESDLALRPLLQRACDVLASVPGREVLGDYAPRVALTRPYYGAAFELVGPGALPDRLDALRGRRIAVYSASVAHLVAQYEGLEWRAYRSVGAQLTALDRGQVEAALVWGPQLGRHDRSARGDFRAPALLRWNMHLATRVDDTPLREALDAELERWLARGGAASLLAEHGVPVHAPFETTFSQAGLDALRQAAR